MRRGVGTLVLLPLLLLSSICTHHLVVDALVVDVSPVTRLANPPSPHEVLEQQWKITNSTPNDELLELQIDAISQVYITYSEPIVSTGSPPLVASVRVTGSDLKLINGVDIERVPLHPAAAALAIKFKEAAHLHGLDGFIRIEVTLHQRSRLQKLLVHGSADVIVTENVLRQADASAQVALELTGSGDLYLPHGSRFDVASLSVSSTGSGRVFIPSATSITAPLIAFIQAGNGEIIATLPEIRAPRNISISASGSGDLCIDTDQLETNVIRVDHSGSGDIYIGHDGTSDAGIYHQSGAGNLDMGSIHCIDVDVLLSGSGNVTVASARSLTGQNAGSGLILYTGQMPDDVAPVDPWVRVTKPIARHTPLEYKPRTCSMPTMPPPRQLTRISIARPAGGAVMGVFSWYVGRILLGLVVVVGFGAVYIFEKRRQRAARRGERTPLLS